MTKDLTKGKPWVVMIQFGLPLLIGNIVQQLYNMADTIMIGNALGMNALAAVGSTGAITFFVLGFCNGMTSGFSVPIAQAFGAKDEEKMRHTIGMAVIWCAVITLAVTTLSCVFCKNILTWMQTPEDIFDDAYRYIFVIFLGIGTTMLYNMSSGILRAVGDSRTPLILLIISAVLNVGMNYILLYVIPLGVLGPAIATVAAQLLSGLACVIFINAKFRMLRLHARDCRIDWGITSNMFGIGLPMALQFSITAIGSMTIQGSVNSLGTAVVGANTAASRALNIAMTPITALGSVMATYAAQNYGAGEYNRIRKGVQQSYVIAAVCLAVSVTYCFAGGRAVMRLFSSDITEEELSIGMIYLWANGAGFFLFGLLHIFRNVLQGVGISLVPLIGGMVELAMRLLISAVCASLVTKLDVSTAYWIISFASPLAWLGADLTLITRYIIFSVRLKRKIREMDEHPETRHKLSIKEL